MSQFYRGMFDDFIGASYRFGSQYPSPFTELVSATQDWFGVRVEELVDVSE